MLTGVAHLFTHYESNVNPTFASDQPGQHLDSNIAQAYLSYSLANEASVQLNLPLIHRRYRRLEDGESVEGTESGVGDITALLKLVPVRNHEAESALLWELFGGLKLPTGDTNRLREESDAAHADEERILRHGGADGSLIGGSDLALGSGSTDLIFGTAVFAQQGRYFASGSVQYGLRREGDYGYQYGDDLFWSLAAGRYLVLEDERSLALKAAFSGDHKREDSIHGDSVEGSREDNVYVGPELEYSLASRWHFDIGVDLPILNESAATQAVPQLRIRGSLAYRF